MTSSHRCSLLKSMELSLSLNFIGQLWKPPLRRFKIYRQNILFCHLASILLREIQFVHFISHSIISKTLGCAYEQLVRPLSIFFVRNYLKVFLCWLFKKEGIRLMKSSALLREAFLKDLADNDKLCLLQDF